MPAKNFNKPALRISQQLELLASRGLKITDQSQALHWLEHIGYYRLSGYWRYLYQDKHASKHIFQAQASFEQIIELYNFDRELKILVLDGIESIEVSVKSTISNILSAQYGAHWFLQAENFKSNFNHDELIAKIKNETNYYADGGSNPIFKAYYQNYQRPGFPPSWMLAEGLSFGTWSKMYAFLAKDKDKKSIAARFVISWIVLQSWLQCICFVRNLCAHHAILGFRQFHIEPLQPKNWELSERKHFAASHSLYAQMVIIHYLLKVIAPGNNWACRVKQLFARYPNVLVQQLGFVAGWDQTSFWRGRAVKRSAAAEVSSPIL